MAMEPGMITSIEPGLYRPGQWGVRIENLVLNVPAAVPEGDAFGEFLEFETLTLCPIDTRCIERSLLREDEVAWLNAYHATVRERGLAAAHAADRAAPDAALADSSEWRTQPARRMPVSRVHPSQSTSCCAGRPPWRPLPSRWASTSAAPRSKPAARRRRATSAGAAHRHAGQGATAPPCGMLAGLVAAARARRLPGSPSPSASAPRQR
jgi:hypothetical protein